MSPGSLPPPAATLLRLAGADALPLLHRLASAALADLAPGAARAALFCDFRGRLLHRVAVAVTADRAVWLLRDDAPGAELLALLDRATFREDVMLADALAGRRVRTVGGTTGPAAGTLREEGGVPRLVQVDEGWALAVEDGAPAGADEADEVARILAARPRHGHEIAGEFTPFEVGLAHEVHLAKGCWTGQETLMRLVTYQGVRRRLVVLEGEGAPPPVPCDLGSRGRLTSACARVGGWVGLGVVALEEAAPGAALALAGGTARVVRAAPETRPAGLPPAR